MGIMGPTIIIASLILNLVTGLSGEDPSSERALVQLSGTTELDNSFRSIITNVWSIIGSGFIAAILVTGAIYLIGIGATGLIDTQVTRRVSSPGQVTQDRWGRRQESLLHQTDKILSFLSADTIQNLSNNIKDEILNSLYSVRDDSLQRVDDATNALTDGISDGIDALGGGSKLEDCILQAICYLTPDEETGEAGESRKNKDKQKRREEKRKEKKNKKNKKNKNKVTDSSDDYDDELVTEASEDDDDNEVEPELSDEDCNVFQCDTVRYGYQMFQLYDKIQNLRSQIDTLRER